MIFVINRKWFLKTFDFAGINKFHFQIIFRFKKIQLCNANFHFHKILFNIQKIKIKIFLNDTLILQINIYLWGLLVIILHKMKYNVQNILFLVF